MPHDHLPPPARDARPDLQAPLPFARHELAQPRAGGLLLPRVVLFHGEEPTVYLRSRPAVGRDVGRTLHVPCQEMLSLAHRVRPTGALVLLHVGMRRAEVPDGQPDPGGGTALVVERAWQDAGAVRCDASWHPVTVRDDGREVVGPAMSDVAGPMAELLRWALGPVPDDPGSRRLDPAGHVYALSRFGHVVAVDSAWRQRLHLDEVPTPSNVRAVDRRRAERARAAWRRARRRAETPAANTREVSR